jgi:mitochondrial fission protein ELM1
LTSDKSSSPVIWRLSDGKAGHEAQSKGLAEALNRLVRCDTFDISVAEYTFSIVDYACKRFTPGAHIPAPHIIIGAGHSTHIPLIVAKRARGGRTIVLMKPSLPMSWFDYCLIPKHDHPPTRNNVITTIGALNTVLYSTEHKPEKGLVLIGGPSRHFYWNTENLIEQLQFIITQQVDVHWTITDSPRTPDGTLIRILEQGWPNIDIVPFNACDSENLHNLYANAGTIWVTEDSVSMVYESLSSGAIVGLLEIPRKNESRISNAMKSLIEEGLLTSFQSWHRANKMQIPDYSINEATRCAEILIQREIYK